jgi:hypothetical protein
MRCSSCCMRIRCLLLSASCSLVRSPWCCMRCCDSSSSCLNLNPSARRTWSGCEGLVGGSARDSGGCRDAARRPAAATGTDIGLCCVALCYVTAAGAITTYKPTTHTCTMQLAGCIFH